MYEQGIASVSVPSLVVLMLWLTSFSGVFGPFAPANTTVIASMFICSLSVSAAISLLLELYSPFSGTIQLSSTPLRTALARLGQ